MKWLAVLLVVATGIPGCGESRGPGDRYRLQEVGSLYQDRSAFDDVATQKAAGLDTFEAELNHRAGDAAIRIVAEDEVVVSEYVKGGAKVVVVSEHHKGRAGYLLEYHLEKARKLARSP